MSTQVVEKRDVAVVRKPAPQYRVLLHNDDYNGMEHVVAALIQTVPSLSPPQAVDIMMAAHNHGTALVITCAMEPAEFYSETLKSHGLSSSIEPEN
ncbi:MAG: ATP-dependent Clp protease adapter ClpS [Synechococcales cyanobacterium RM1_1_8]|nr:ATP-dependent Clp protease adapter ClpS [Synechococcales cyanobacterium RM1_1_8]